MFGLLQRLFFGGSLRYKLLSLVLVPLLLLAGTLIYLSANWYSDYTYQQLFTKVNTDLRVAHDIFNRIETDRQREIASLAESARFRHAIDQGDPDVLTDLLVAHRLEHGLDFLNLISADGTERLTRMGWTYAPSKKSPLTEAVLNTSTRAQPFAAGVEIYRRHEWMINPQIDIEKVLLPLVDTERAAPTTRKHEDRAMVIRVLQAVRDDEKQLVAVLEGGLLLNGNFAFVDEIRDLVYGPGSLAVGSRGTVTVFLDDVRITTNVPGRIENRALGTRVSVEVRDTVLRQGKNWIDRAFVVNDWYISAYEPIIDVNGEKVGMLYAGYLEAPFRADLERAISWLAAVVVAGCCLAIVVAAVGAKTIFKPIESINSVVRATARGQSRRIGAIETHDEIGELATQFDSMLDALEEQRARIDEHTHQLEDKVELRTSELQQKNDSLQQSINLLRETREQLAGAEKLAALGHLTAGVAHEINNPTAVILGNMEVLAADIGDARDQVETEINLIYEQVYRIRAITDKLLQYSRPSSYTPDDQREDHPPTTDAAKRSGHDSTALSVSPCTPIQINELVDESVVLVQHEIERKSIELVEHLGEVGLVEIDAQEFQQVMVNLLMNATQAIAINGRIDIRTSHESDDLLKVSVKDNGVGIDPAHLPQLFDPFFTSGKERGTGLGLSLSYGIVHRYGGRLEVSSTPGEGATFDMYLPRFVGSEDTSPDQTAFPDAQPLESLE